MRHARDSLPAEVRRTIGLDIDVLWVLTEPEPETPQLRRVLERLGTIVDISGSDPDTAATILAGYEPDGVISFVDDHLCLAARLAERLDLSFHTPQVAAGLVDKLRQRTTLAAAGVAGPRFWAIPKGTGMAELRTIAAQCTYPAVLKPAAGSGSRGIRSLHDRNAVLGLYPVAEPYLVEAYLEDDPQRDVRFASYLSLESLVCQGQITHVTTSGRFPLAEPFRETGNFVPAAVGPDELAELAQLTEAAIRGLGITTGVLHTEIKLTPEGPRLIEVNGRLGGRPPALLASISDVNLVRAAAEIALGRTVDLPDFAPTQGFAYWRMFQPPIGATRIRAIRGLETLARISCVDSVHLLAGPGDRVDVGKGTDGQVLTVRGRVAALDTLAEAVATVDATVDIAYEREADGAVRHAAGEPE